MVVFVLLSWPLAACGLGGSQVRVHDVRATPPSKIAVLVSVRDADGPVSHLDAEAFRIQENDVELDPALNPVALGEPSSMQSEVIVVVDAGESAVRPLLVRGLHHLANKLRPSTHLKFYAFQGDARLVPLGELEARPDAELEAGADGETDTPSLDFSSLLSLPSDNAVNLRGALLEGLRELERTRTGDLPFRGALVVVALGPDTAGSVQAKSVWEELDRHSHLLYIAKPEGMELEFDHRAELVVETSSDDLPMRLMDLSMAVRDDLEATYLLEYCSKARAGQRKLSIRVTYDGPDGSPRGGLGRAASAFDAAQFRAGCVLEDDPSPSPLPSPEEASARAGTPDDARNDGSAPSSDPPADAPQAASAPPAARRVPKPAPKKATTPPRQGTGDGAPPVVAPPAGDNYR